MIRTLIVVSICLLGLCKEAAAGAHTVFQFANGEIEFVILDHTRVMPFFESNDIELGPAWAQEQASHPGASYRMHGLALPGLCRGIVYPPAHGGCNECVVPEFRFTLERRLGEDPPVLLVTFVTQDVTLRRCATSAAEIEFPLATTVHEALGESSLLEGARLVAEIYNDDSLPLKFGGIRGVVLADAVVSTEGHSWGVLKSVRR